MHCQNCGASMDENTKFCSVCGASVEVSIEPTSESKKVEIPKEHTPLGAWAYFGLRVLFSIPLVGFVFLLIFSFSDSNINRRDFARSYWCELAVSLIIVLLTIILCLIVAALGFGVSEFIEQSLF